MDEQPYSTLQDTDLNPDRFMISEDMDLTRPVYSTAEVAKVFFGKSAAWIRWRERDGDFTLDGQPIVVSRAQSNIRKFTLLDVERMIYALSQRRVLQPPAVKLALHIVRCEAKLYGVLDD